MTLDTKELLKKIQKIQVICKKTVDELLAGSYHSVFKGQGIEFDEVRGYLPGDDVRTIDWNVTARMGDPYIKRFREERQLTVNLLVDISSSLKFGGEEGLKSDFVAELGAALAFSAIDNGDKVGLILFSDQVELYLPPATGIKHVLRVIRELLGFEAKNKKTSISSALHFLGKVQKKKGVCFLISDFIDESYDKQISLSSKRHDLISVLVYDQLEKKLPKLDFFRFYDSETGEELLVDTKDLLVRSEIEKEFDLRIGSTQSLMKKLGAGFIPLRVGESYVQPLLRYFQERTKRL